MKKELKVCNTKSNLWLLESIDDPFVQEVISMWKEHNRNGILCWIPVESDKEPKWDVASFVLLEQDRDWTIRGTWTHPDYRKQGLSSFILQHIIGELELFNPFGWLWVNITTGAESVYEKAGFKIYGQRTDTDEPISVGVYSRYDKDREIQRFVEKFPCHELFEEKD